MSGGGFAAPKQNDRLLPAGAEMMDSGIDREKEIGVAVGCSYPLAVDADSRGRCGMAFESGVVFEEIDQRLGGVGLSGIGLSGTGLDQVLTLGRFDGEFSVGIAASGGLQVLGKCRGRDEKNS